MKLLCSSAETLLTTEDRSSFRGYQVMNVAFLFLSFLRNNCKDKEGGDIWKDDNLSLCQDMKNLEVSCVFLINNPLLRVSLSINQVCNAQKKQRKERNMS